MPTQTSTGVAGQVVIVAGGAGGIGRAVVERAVAERAHAVVVADLHADGAELVADQIERGETQLHATTLDVTDPQSCERLVREARERFGRVDSLVVATGVNSQTLRAGGAPAGKADIVDLDVDLVRTMFEINCLGAMNVDRAFARVLRDEGRPGALVNITSIAATRAVSGNAAYCVSKSALSMMTKCLALELALLGIRVNAVSPGYVNTAMTTQGWASSATRPSGEIPLGRYAEPAEVAPAVTFLLSADAGYLTGSELVADGGVLSRR